MKIEQIMPKLDYILEKIKEMDTLPLESEEFETKLMLISNAVDILRDQVEYALKEREENKWTLKSIERLDDLERTPLGSLVDDIGIIRCEVEALRDSVEDALNKKED